MGTCCASGEKEYVGKSEMPEYSLLSLTYHLYNEACARLPQELSILPR